MGLLHVWLQRHDDDDDDNNDEDDDNDDFDDDDDDYDDDDDDDDYDYNNKNDKASANDFTVAFVTPFPASFPTFTFATPFVLHVGCC